MNAYTSEGRRYRWGGIRARIVIGYVILLSAALAISIVVTRQLLVGRLEREINQALAQEIEELRSLAGSVDPATGEPFGPDAAAILDTFLRRSVPGTNEAFYALVGGDRFLASFDAPQEIWEDDPLISTWVAIDAPTQATVSTALGEVRYLAVPLTGPDGVAGVFVVAYFPESEQREILVVVRILTVAGLVVLLASAALAWSLAGRVLRPVRELTATARRISDADLSDRIEVTGNDELAELGETFNDMVARLEQGFDQQRRFLDDVAHELRTPITIIQGHVELLNGDSAERAEGVAIVSDELDRMNRYVGDLLLLAKADSDDFLRMEPIDLGEFAMTIEQRVRHLGDRVWVMDSAPRPGTVAMLGDHGRLVQAMLNLATNAVQHTRDGDEIGIGIDVVLADVVADAHPAGTARCARFWVRDTGSGIDPASIDQLFARRFRGAASRAQRAEGMGIGLSIVDAIARAHGGHASAANEPGAGARFTIELPIDTAAEEIPCPES